MDTAVISLIIFVFTIILFILDIFPMATTAILGCVLMVVFGGSSFSAAFGQLASSTVILTIGIMVVGQALMDTGMAARIGRVVARFSKGNERGLIAISFVVAAAMSMFLTNSAVLACFFPIFASISSTNPQYNMRNLIMPIAIASVVGGGSTLVGSTQQMTANGLVETALGYGYSIFDFTKTGIFVMIAGLLYCVFIGYPLGKKLWGDRPSEDGFVAEKMEINETKFKTISISVIFLGMLVLYITELIPIAVTSTVAAVACIVTGCTSQNAALKNVNWNIVGRLGGCLGLAKCMEEGGGIELLKNGFLRIIGPDFSPFLLFVIAVFAVQLFSEFMSNSTAILIVLPLIIAIAPSMNLNIFSFGMGISLGSSFCSACPLASSTMGMSMGGGYTFKDYFKYGVVYDVICFFLIIIVTPFFFPLTM